MSKRVLIIEDSRTEALRARLVLEGAGYQVSSASDGREGLTRATEENPDLVVLDGVEAFVGGGPAQGKKVQANLILAGTDRVAIDAVGVAVLRHFGTTPEISRGPIFEQEQISRAVDLGLGVGSADQIELITDDSESAAYARQIQEILLSG